MWGYRRPCLEIERIFVKEGGRMWNPKHIQFLILAHCQHIGDFSCVIQLFTNTAQDIISVLYRHLKLLLKIL
jgi:hypothetical protein